MAEENRRIVILGVGNRLRGDDAIGCLVCDELLAEQDKDSPPRHKDTKEPSAESSIIHSPSSVPGLFVLDCGSTPENYVQPIADRKPTRILVVDCCDYGAKPGEFRLFNRSEIEKLSYGLISTHTMPLTLTIEMLSVATKAAIELLGVQPQQIEFGTDLSPAVRGVLPALVQFVRDWARP